VEINLIYPLMQAELCSSCALRETFPKRCPGCGRAPAKTLSPTRREPPVEQVLMAAFAARRRSAAMRGQGDFPEVG
jgi:hypothetical protein